MTNTDITTSISQEIAERATALLQSQIRIEDLVLPRLYIGQPGSGAVQAGYAPTGSIYLATDKDGPEPVIVYKPGAKTGVRVHLLTVEKVWCFTDDEGNYRVVSADAVRRREVSVPDEVEAGTSLPCASPSSTLRVSALFKVTAIPTTKKILTTVAKAGAAPWSSAFELITAQKSNDRGYRWYIPLATVVKPHAKHVTQAAALAEMLLAHRPREIASNAEKEDDRLGY